MKKALFLFCTLGLLLSYSCKKSQDSNWLIPSDKVEDGGPGKDGIPALDNPNFISSEEVTYLNDSDLVLGLKVGNTVRAYPIPILDWHEIINDEIEGKQIAIVYCPLTGTGIGWDRMVNGNLTTFGVSGLLYNSNIIPYDRSTDSNWSQMLLKAVNGELIGMGIDTYTLFETEWGLWKEMYPEAEVVSTDTGHARNYNSYPYGSYRTDNRLIFPVTDSDDRRTLKDRVLGVIIDEQAKLYSFDDFESPTVVKDQFAGIDLVVVGSSTDNYIHAFEQTFPDLNFEAYSNPNNPSIIMTDNEGNEWDAFGTAISGPKEGQELKSAPSFMGYFFSFATFYPGVEIH